MKFHPINRLSVAAALTLGCLAIGGIAVAPPGEGLVGLRGGATMSDPLVPGVIESAKNSLVPTNPQLQQQLNEVAAQLRKEFDPKRAEILNEVAKVYAQRFTEPELKEIVAFYKTPIGKKMSIEEPIALDQSLKVAQAWATRFSDEVLDRIRSEMKKKGYNL